MYEPKKCGRHTCGEHFCMNEWLDGWMERRSKSLNEMKWNYIYMKIHEQFQRDIHNKINKIVWRQINAQLHIMSCNKTNLYFGEMFC